MTASIHHTPSLSIPPTQNTAPVLEFNCLYTHDIRRKQKRWQDGFLRYHTFNKRVMVYDVPRNFIGDMHWTAGSLAEGDEVMLEKDAVLVQVAEQVGTTETDLTEIRASVGKKKVRREDGSSSARGVATPARSLGGNATPSRSMAPPASRAGAGTQLKHRSLNALLGTPKGQLGKAALPVKSPFEERQQDLENDQWENGRPPKRQRTEPWSVTRITSAAQQKSTKKAPTPLWARTSDAKNAVAAKAKKTKVLGQGQSRLGTKEIIELSDDGEEESAQFLPGFSSDALVPPTSPAALEPIPARRTSPAQPAKPSVTVRKAAVLKAAVRSSSPAFQTQNAPPRQRDGKAGPPSDDHPGTVSTVQTKPRRPAAPRDSPEPPVAMAPPFLPPPTSSKAAQTLRMATSAPKRKTLACLDQLATKPASQAQKTSRSTSPESGKPKRMTQQELVEERLAKMRKKALERAEDLNAVLDDVDAMDDAASIRPQTPVTELTKMDQMLLQQQTSEPPSRNPLPNGAPEKTARPFQRVASEPVPAPTETTKKQDRPFQRVASEHGTSVPAKPKRIPGAPVRYTPSPTKRSPASDSGSRRGSTSSVQSHTGALVSPRDVAPVAQQESNVVRAKEADVLPETMAAPPKPTTRRKGVGRKEIRKSAQACFTPKLDNAANGNSPIILGRSFQTPKIAAAADAGGGKEIPPPPKPPPTAKEAGPWSRDAFDLFEWRPTGWDEEEWRMTPAVP